VPSPDNQSPIARHQADVVAGGVLFVMAIAIAFWYVPLFSASGGRPRYYQEEFGAAVMEACGFGFVNPERLASAELAAFLSRQTDEIACSALSPPPPAPLRPMQRAFRYLMTTVAGMWRLSGHVAWSALTPTFAALYGVTIVLAFAIFRQGMGTGLAAAAAAALAISTLQLNNLPHLRDFAKAPFVLALVLIAMRLVARPFERRRTLVLAAVAGAVTGVGMGFRNDVMVAVPAFVALPLMFLPIGWRRQWGTRVMAAAGYLLAVALAMLPMLPVYSTGGGSSSQHLVLLGLTPGFSRDLGVDNSRLYEWGFEYRDELALAMIDNYSDRRLARHEFLRMYGADYDRAASQYLRDIAVDFPADLLTRVYASAVRIVELPYSLTTSALMPPPYVQGAALALFETRSWIVRWLGVIWPWAFAFTLMALSLRSLRLGIFAALLVFYLSGYPALQFQERHFFHLEFVAWWVLGCATSIIGHAAIAVAQGRENWTTVWTPPGGWRAPALKAAGLWTSAAILIVVPLWVLRGYQREHGPGVIRSIVSAPRVDVAVAASGDMPDLIATLPPDDGVHAHYLVADLGGPACDLLDVPVTFRYVAQNPIYDFSHTKSIRMPLVNDPLALFVPVYYRSPGSTDRAQEPFAFRGLELPDAARPCLMRVSRVAHPEALPVLMEMRLPPDWQRSTPYATITGVEGRENPAAVYTFPADLSRHSAQRALARSSSVFSPGDVKTMSPTFSMDGARWRVDGIGGVGGRGPLLYLVEMKDRPLKKHTAFVAEGRIDKGGITFGLVRGVEWIVQLHIRQTGPFAAVIEVPEDGEYRVIMANNLLNMSLVNRVTVSRAGLVAPDAMPTP
jgi:hypothetical protein